MNAKLNLKQSILLASLVILLGCGSQDRQGIGPAPQGGDGVGNGGDAVAMDFRKVAEGAITLAETNNSGALDFTKLKDILSKASISSTEKTLFLGGEEKDAVNYPSAQKIIINRQRYTKYEDERLKAVLALHEILGLSQISDEMYEKSSMLIGYDPVSQKEILKKVDVLFVVDDSGSMEMHQQSLISNIEYFVKKIKTEKMNYHIGVITTSDSGGVQPCYVTQPYFTCAHMDGRLLRGYITPFTPNGLQKLEKNLKVGTAGSAEEKPFLTLMRALSNEHPENSGFLRADANLEIIVISDAADQSADTNDVLNFLLALKPSATEKISFSAFIPLPGDASCPAENRVIDYSSYYNVMKPLHGGIFSLCPGSIKTGLEAMSWDISNRMTKEAP